MATVTVCDICGKDATGTRTIDVCDDHTDGAAPRRAMKKVRCEVCGKRISAGAGLAAHMRSHEA